MFAVPLTPRKKRQDGQGDLYWDRIRWPAKQKDKADLDKEKSIEETPTPEKTSENIKSQSAKTHLAAKDLYRLVGPGVVTGSADNDPSGIATYSQAGAQFGLGMLWLALFQFPLITAVQEACARIGIVTGSGLGAIIGKKYNRKVAVPLASLLLIANTINIGADIGAMSASVRLIVPEVPLVVATIGFTALIIVAEIAVPYKKYVKGLKYLTISLFAYILTSIIVGGNWERLLVATFVPHVELSPQYAMMFVAMFGTTISPYLFYWQASEEAEEQVAEGKIKEIGKGKPKVGKKQVKLMKLDVSIGMIFSQVIAWFIITTAAGSLNAHGITNISTAEDVAKSLEPLVKTFPYSGVVAKTIFAFGIVGTGLLAVPVLAGSCGYALADGFGWRQGLGRKFKHAKAFYLVIAAATLVGLWINFTNIDPIKALVYTAVINGIIAVPILVAVVKIANDRRVLGKMTNGRMSNVLLWLTVVVMGISDVILLLTWGYQ
jgi:NRAMP (natural resistance-associated macrophage protein)-like metal ion transporter